MLPITSLPGAECSGNAWRRVAIIARPLEVYARAEPLGSGYTAAAECLIHATWINLSLGNDIEGARLIQLLARAPAAVTRGISGGAQLRELEALVATGRSAECWSAGRAWWAEWAKFAVQLGAPQDMPEYGVPEIRDAERLEDSIRRSVQARDQKAYMRQLSILLSAARWQPSLGPEASALASTAVTLAGNSANDLRGVLIRMLASPHPREIAGYRERSLCLAVNYIDVGQPGEALRIAAEFGTVDQPNDNTTQAMHRVRALAALATGRDYSEAAAGLEADLANPKASVQRGMAAGLLSDLYLALGRNADSARLLKRETSNPAVAADPTARAFLASRLECLRVRLRFASPCPSPADPGPGSGLV